MACYNRQLSLREHSEKMIYINSLTIAYGALAIAILCEVAGTIYLMKSSQFTKLMPTLMMAVLYGCSFFFLSQALKTIPLGLAYALWGGLGIVVTALIGVAVFKQTLDLPAVLGISMIVGGVAVIHLFSQSTPH